VDRDTRTVPEPIPLEDVPLPWQAAAACLALAAFASGTAALSAEQLRAIAERR
jgi:hypothetical protein